MEQTAGSVQVLGQSNLKPALVDYLFFGLLLDHQCSKFLTVISYVFLCSSIVSNIEETQSTFALGENIQKLGQLP